MKKFYSFLLVFLVILIIQFTLINNSFSQMFWNTAGKFDSTTTVSFENSTPIDLTGSFTIEAWLNPSDTTTPGGIYNNQRQIIYKEKYNITLRHGKPMLLINGTYILSFKTGIAPNKWNHIAFTRNAATNIYSCYLNGVLDTTRMVSIAPQSTNHDLYIGSNPLLNTAKSNYKGYMDDIRIWTKSLTETELSTYFRTFLGVGTGIYDGLSFSLGFQTNESTSYLPGLLDISDNSMMPNREIDLQALDLKSRPVETNSFNEALELDGTGDYVAAKSMTDITPSSSITLESWIYPRSYSGATIIILKGPPTFVSPKYHMGLTVAGKLYGTINGNQIVTTTTIPLNEWSHIAFQYKSSGEYNFYTNGENVKQGNLSPALMGATSDSLYIGGTSGTGFNGYIDEIRIQSFYKTEAEIQKQMYISKDFYNKNNSNIDVAYNLDGLQFSNTSKGPRLRFRNNARFSHPSTISNQPVSPLLRADSRNFQKGFFIKQSDRLIPATGTSGLMTEDSLVIDLDVNVTDVNFFIATNHTFSNDLEITLVSPQDYEAFVCFDVGQLGSNDNIVTIFDDQADSAIISGRYTSITPFIKPQVDMNTIFENNTCKGVWKLRINDDNSGNSGRLYAWGIQINNLSEKTNLLSTNCLLQGFYNAGTNSMIRDTMRFYLRNSLTPYAIIDSSKSYLGSLGNTDVTFPNSLPGKYYLMLKHRNSIETWSSTALNFDAFTQSVTYNFKTDIASAYGNNMIQVDSSPIRYALYGGDVNQDGIVDGTDGILIDNDASNFATGYLSTDLNGDEVIDGSDAVIADNNAANFVSAITP